MLLVCYDISSDKLRTKLCKYLKKFGKHVQYSIFEIDNSQRYLRIILNELENKFKNKFTWSDTVVIYNLNEADQSKTIRFGWSVTEEKDLVVF